MSDIYNTNEQKNDPQIVVRMNGISDVNLPPGWMGVNHKCGGIVYLHRESRVVTWSRPYCIAKDASIRKHDIPLLSIPCLHQKRTAAMHRKCLKRKFQDDTSLSETKVSKQVTVSELDETRKQDRLDTVSELDETRKQDWLDMDSGVGHPDNKKNLSEEAGADVSVKADENNIHEIVDSKDVHTYLSNIFEFDVLSAEYSTVPLFTDSGKKVVGPIPSKNAPKKKNMIVVEGKTPLQILNEYCQKKLKTQMKFKTINTGVVQEFLVQVQLNDLLYGIGKGDTSKQAKHEAALNTVNILDPLLIPKTGEQEYFKKDQPCASGSVVLKEQFELFKNADELNKNLFEPTDSDVEEANIVDNLIDFDEDDVKKLPDMSKKLFDALPIQDPSIFHTIRDMELPSELEYPYQILFKLLRRQNPSLQESDICFTVTEVKKKRYQYEMKYKQYVASGICRKRKYAQNLASQNIIQQIYPQLKYWGSIIRLNRATVPETNISQEKKKPEPANRSEALINALKTEMRKIT